MTGSISTVRQFLPRGRNASGRTQSLRCPAFVEVRMDRGKNVMPVRMSASTFLTCTALVHCIENRKNVKIPEQVEQLQFRSAKGQHGTVVTFRPQGLWKAGKEPNDHVVMRAIRLTTSSSAHDSVFRRRVSGLWVIGCKVGIT